MPIKLPTPQRNFFQSVAETAFTNPFSPESETRELKLLKTRVQSPSQEYLLTELLKTIRSQFLLLSPDGNFSLLDYQGHDRAILEISCLFYHYRAHQHTFDEFIRNQQQAGDTLLPLPFAEQLTKALTDSGFNRAQTAKYIALFFQLRRGYYFISQGVYGLSPSMVQLRMQLWNNIFTFKPEWYLNFLCEQMEDFSTLLLGETGTGKSMVAHAIGSSGFIPFDLDKQTFRESFTRAFQAINLSQYPSTLLESELFGHKKGAFTGAIDNHQGLFARCSTYGAIFIDEIGDIDIPTQVKLLNVIQDRVFCPVGSHTRSRFDGRVIAATNRDIEQLRMQGQFRDDLYYRLCSDVITIPPLRQRLQEQSDELYLLIHTILKRMFPEAGMDLTPNIEVLIRNELPENYAWPGNVRELEQCIRRICLSGHYPALTPHQPEPQKQTVVFSIDDELPAAQLLQCYCRQLYQKYPSYEAVARITGLDRRTVKKHIDSHANNGTDRL